MDTMTIGSIWLTPLVQACRLCQKPPATFHFTHNFSEDSQSWL